MNQVAQNHSTNSILKDESFPISIELEKRLAWWSALDISAGYKPESNISQRLTEARNLVLTLIDQGPNAEFWTSRKDSCVRLSSQLYLAMPDAHKEKWTGIYVGRLGHQKAQLHIGEKLVTGGVGHMFLVDTASITNSKKEEIIIDLGWAQYISLKVELPIYEQAFVGTRRQLEILHSQYSSNLQSGIYFRLNDKIPPTGCYRIPEFTTVHYGYGVNSFTRQKVSHKEMCESI